jgi:hypothetical protein
MCKGKKRYKKKNLKAKVAVGKKIWMKKLQEQKRYTVDREKRLRKKVHLAKGTGKGAGGKKVQEKHTGKKLWREKGTEREKERRTRGKCSVGKRCKVEKVQESKKKKKRCTRKCSGQNYAKVKVLQVNLSHAKTSNL